MVNYPPAPQQVLMYEPTQRQLTQWALLWPAMAAASASETAALMAKHFLGLASHSIGRPVDEPAWATSNAIALELKTVRLRDFSSAAAGAPTLLCAPFALHGATVTDIAPGHSLVAHLRDAGLDRLFVADWRSAESDMRFLAIDDYLATLNVLVDQLGGRVDLVGLCQGGWLAVLYAARFPAKVRKLAIAGAPIDIAAARSGLSDVTAATPSALLQELVKLGDGRVLGHKVASFWGMEAVTDDDIRRTLQSDAPLGSTEFADLAARFRAWHDWTVDLPGVYYLEIIERLYKRNALATGEFVALGERLDLARLTAPLYLLAARDDELVAPAQLFATARRVGTAPDDIREATAPCRHLGLFMGCDILRDYWNDIAAWLKA